MPQPSTDCAWEDSKGLIHWVPFTIGDRYTCCDVRIAWAPGVWSDLPIACLPCLAATKKFKGKLNEQVPPVLRREAGMFIFRWPFRTTGSVIHGAMPRLKHAADFYDLNTLCGVSTYQKLQKGTGRWTHGREALTCIGCLAMARAA